eukprot:SAG31_NODE_851_length_11519_cov_4.727145_14_plen_238_part_00
MLAFARSWNVYTIVQGRNANGCACPSVTDTASHPKAAVFFERPEEIDAISIVSGAAGNSQYHLQGGVLWYSTDPDLSAEDRTWEDAVWHPLMDLEFASPIADAEIRGNNFHIPSFDVGLVTIDFHFATVRATGLMIEVFATDAPNHNIILAELSVFTACLGPPPEEQTEGSEWILVAEEAPGDTGNDDLRTLSLTVPDYFRVRMEWGAGDNFAEFDVPAGISIFGDYVRFLTSPFYS